MGRLEANKTGARVFSRFQFLARSQQQQIRRKFHISKSTLVDLTFPMNKRPGVGSGRYRKGG